MLTVRVRGRNHYDYHDDAGDDDDDAHDDGAEDDHDLKLALPPLCRCG